MAENGEVTRLLAAMTAGDRTAFHDLLPLVYDELRDIAHRHLRGERAGQTLATTDLVHEAYFALVGIDRVSWSDRAHFLAVAARAMRRVLINRAVARGAEKRGGGRLQTTLEDAAIPVELPDDQMLALDEALRGLEARNERYGHIVECRFFAGMSIEETASALGVSPATVKRDWVLARAWLHRELSQ
jgi:RNA polymerase sigma factor (TIGR02999 family)